MIVVLADDITGAAELAGISKRFFSNVKLYLQTVPKKVKADVVVICSASRGMKKQMAITTTKKLLQEILKLNPSFIYKKIDSVLRGYVYDELLVQMSIEKKHSALIVPANPSLGRIIKNGKYYVNDILLHKTNFKNDPEFPRTTSDAEQLVSTNCRLYEIGIQNLYVGTAIAQTQTTTDVKILASLNWDYTVLAGGGDFYLELLKVKYKPIKAEKYQLNKPHLYVSGTAYNTAVTQIEKWSKQKKSVLYIPNRFTNKAVQTICENINDKKIIAFNKPTASPLILQKKMATLVQQIVSKKNCKEIFIEGGATAEAIFEQLKINEFESIAEYNRGTVVLQNKKTNYVLKPGSYVLPKEIFNLYNTK